MTTPVERGCGFRVEGGAYLVAPLSPVGTPLWQFLVDPPIVVDTDAMGISPMGMTPIQHGETIHMLDWVGSQHYPHPADFIEETRRFGLSRRISKTTDFSQLHAGSCLMLIHDRAHIVEHADYQAERIRRGDDHLWCPTYNAEHAKPEYRGHCVGLFWEDVIPDTPQEDRSEFVRTMPSFSYKAYPKPELVRTSRLPAIFMRIPIAGIEVVRGEGAEQTAERASRSNLPVTIVEA